MGIMHTVFVVSEVMFYGARLSIRCLGLHDLGLRVPGAGSSARISAGTDGCRALCEFRSGGRAAGVDGAEEFAHYTVKDWIDVSKLGVIGNIAYYWCLIECIQNAGVPVAGMAMSAVPVLVAAVSNIRDKKKGTALAWSRLVPGLTLIVCGFALASMTEFEMVVQASADGGLKFWYGVMMAVAALLIWTWYPIRNADWLLAHPDRSPRAWSTAQGLTTFPFAVVMYFFFWGLEPDATPLLGYDPAWFVFVMVFSGLMGSWVGIVFWNAMSQRLPTALAGQMIVFETIFAVTYAHVLRMQWPEWNMLAGMALLLSGVMLSLKVFQTAKAQHRSESV